MSGHYFSRRRMLRGLGVTMALPWLESKTVWGDEPKARQSGSQAPARMAILFSGCGFHSGEWWAKGQGSNLELGKVLHPLNEFRDRMMFINGLYNAEALKGNIHSSQTGNLLSGAPLSSGGTIRSARRCSRSDDRCPFRSGTRVSVEELGTEHRPSHRM